MRILDLDKLKEGLPGISPAFGSLFAEAAAVCLTTMGHVSGVRLKVIGDFEAEFAIVWTFEIGQPKKMGWGDSREAAEFGATALALLLISVLTNYHEFERKEQGDGYDFNMWKNVSENEVMKNIEERARLEISGIFKEAPGNSVQARIAIKKRQTTKSHGQNLPLFIVVVEFKTPKAKIIQA